MRRDGRRPAFNSGPRINHQIRALQVRVIGADGAQLGLFSVDGAVKLAEEGGFDLVEVSPQATPPVCKIMDYGKYKYQQSKKVHQNKRHQVVVHLKEVKLRPNTDDHDLDFKIKHVRRFIEDKDKAKITVVFRGREMAHTDKGADLLKRVIKATEDVATIERDYKMEGRAMTLILAPK